LTACREEAALKRRGMLGRTVQDLKHVHGQIASVVSPSYCLLIVVGVQEKGNATRARPYNNYEIQLMTSYSGRTVSVFLPKFLIAA